MGFKKVHLHIGGKTGFTAIPSPLLFQQLNREMVLEAITIPLPSLVVIFCFFVARAMGWGWGGVMVSSRNPKDSSLKMKRVLEGE